MANYNRDWDALGRNIQEVVDRAVNSKDFQKLDRTIRQIVDRATTMGGEAICRTAQGTANTNQTVYSVPRKLYGGIFGKSALSVFKLVAGIPISLFAVLGVIGGTISGDPVSESLPAMIFLLLVLAGGACLILSGADMLGLVNRYKIYRRILGQNTHCKLEALARSVFKTERFVRRDVRRMITKGFFLEGHLDKEETCLITSDETYRYYEQSRIQMEQQRQNAAVQQKVPDPQESQLQSILSRGNAFIAQIRKCNDDIPGEEISAKIDRMELIVRRIFDRAKSHPEIVQDLKKLMDYYLPMTVKLLEAYADMDAQPVQGETIRASKQEIDATLDTLNQAFEKLLDSIYEDTALDVSSDISVLNTLLAQEGLTQSDFVQP
ncbi:MAG: 5-bromo-4-chloroindolyl phosphate hydrolysis family protein [Oscillospiraceae bacterium]|nr:5-bromo-4-chloroindolyl phosphate hydrolysis family protein [Oscillospiraceae bacterium]